MDLVILAAGMGSRFGGLKQIEPVDEKNNFIIDYSIYDALEAGFDRVVFIIKKELENEFKETIGRRMPKGLKVAYAFQELNKLPEGCSLPNERVKPWGTVHALYCAKDVIHGDFAIINADDFYGKDAFRVAADYLKKTSNKEETSCANVAYFAKNTLSKEGSVKRGILEINQEGIIQEVVESKVEWIGEEIQAVPLCGGEMKKIPLDTMVSMNLFIFRKEVLSQLEEKLKKYLLSHQDDLLTCEYLVTDLVSELIKEEKTTCKLLSTDSTWYGITYKKDLPEVVRALKELVIKGEYPKDRF